ncbi:MAG: ABC transporter ATP-binding protein [Rhodobiaceae bacterium]|nr:ABC transporter ATP-binding protein [Rhodobiaceae bacterium]
MSPAVLEVRDLVTRYGAAQILFGVSLEVRRGEVVALMGRNGAGKTTTLKSIVSLVPSTGTVRFAGADISAEPPYRIAQRGLGYVPEERRIFTNLTVSENLEVGRQAQRGDADPWTPERLFELFPNLAEMRNRPASQMSGGEQQMLTIARTLMGNPTTVLLDEPSEGLAPVIVEKMAEAVKQLKAEGLSVLLSEQNLYFARTVSDRAYVIESGQIRYEGTMADVFSNDEVRTAYLSV